MPNLHSLIARVTIFTKIKHVVDLSEVRELGSISATKLHQIIFKSRAIKGCVKAVIYRPPYSQRNVTCKEFLDEF